MATLQPTFEEESPLMQDPWDWTVDYVVFALTDTASPLLRANPSLSLPNAFRFAKVLRDNDVNGLALLTLVNPNSLKADFEVKSYRHLASINNLIRQLQSQSFKYKEQYPSSGIASSAGIDSRIGSPTIGLPIQSEPRPLDLLNLCKPPINPTCLSHAQQGLNDFPSQLEEQIGVQSSTVADQGLQHATLAGKFGVLESSTEEISSADCLESSALAVDENGGKLDKDDVEGLAATTLNDEPCPINAASNAGGVLPEINNRPGETTIIDQTGKKRRRLILVQPEDSEPTDTQRKSNLSADKSLASSFDTLLDDKDVSHSAVITNAAESNIPFSQQDLVISDALMTGDSSQHENIEPAPLAPPKPGLVTIDENGRKRMQPILISQLDYEGMELQESVNAVSCKDKKKQGEMTSSSSVSRYGRRALGKPRQIYLGHDPMPVDVVFYGNIKIDQSLDKIEETAPEKATTSEVQQNSHCQITNEICLMSRRRSATGQQIYVNNRMKAFLLAQPFEFNRGAQDCVGIIPYPDRMGRKHQPLSMTLFSKFHSEIVAIRANRSKWLSDIANAQDAPHGSIANVFNVAGAEQVLDDSNDPEWKALEKWKYMDGNDDILPLYGESGSEDEYDLDTWKEIEQESGKLPRPIGRSRSQKLSDDEVEKIIRLAIEHIRQDWTVKRLPKLQSKAWRLWAKSRRESNVQEQKETFKQEMNMLEARVQNLRQEIAKEEWSNAGQLTRQCNIMQVSIFDQEDRAWKMKILSSRKAPEKVPSTEKRQKSSGTLEHSQVLKEGEEVIASEREDSDASDGSLDGFVVNDDIDTDVNRSALVDDELMADVEDEAESDVDPADADTAKLLEPETKLPGSPIEITSSPQVTQNPTPPYSNIIDLTLSDPVEPVFFKIEAESSFAIKTPPIHSSENDSEILQRSRGKKPTFRVPPKPRETATYINLDSDSGEPVIVETPTRPVKEQAKNPEEQSLRKWPAFSDIDGIWAMDPSELVARQDRKRLLIYIIAHTQAARRTSAWKYLKHTGFEASRSHVMRALRNLKAGKQRLEDMDEEKSEKIMLIASWLVSWTIPVKANKDGLSKSHIETTLADADGYTPFYHFLLQYLDSFDSSSSAAENTPKKKREIIPRESSNEGFAKSTIRKRKYVVTESQETLAKRQAAQERMRENVRRRRQELESHLSAMGPASRDDLDIVVNPGKLEDQKYVHLNPRFGNGARMRSHQHEGLQFMWREVTADHDNLQGCLLAHEQGLGKTMQVIALLTTLAEAGSSPDQNIRDQVPGQLRLSRTLILCPPGLIENWWDELMMWPPESSSKLLGKVWKVTSELELSLRVTQIESWSTEGGVLILGYQTFRDLVVNKLRPDKRKNDEPRSPPLDEIQHRSVKEALLERPNIVVADEAQNFKTQTSALNKTINRIKTTSRIALTGTPLANDLGEYYSVIDWIAPNYLGTPTEFRATYEEPIYHGLYHESSEREYRESRKRLKALEIEVEPKVHRKDVSVLRSELKGKMEFVVKVPLTDLQDKLYRTCIDSIQKPSDGGKSREALMWSWVSVLQLLCDHPYCFRQKLLEIKAEAEAPLKRKTPHKKSRQPLRDDRSSPGSDEDALLLAEPVSQIAMSQTILDTEKIFDNLSEPLDSIALSNKMSILMGIVDYACSARDKVLIFSHRIAALDYVGKKLEEADRTYARIDGSIMTQKRQTITKDFNHGPVDICLISTRAGGTGLNLFGANRIVILDESYNPIWERQAIGRAYRIGQTKPVYIYRLTAAGTFEQTIQNQGIFKVQLATRVVDKKNPNRSAVKGAGDYLFPPKVVPKQDLTEFIGKDRLVLDRLLSDQTKNQIVSIVPSETYHIEDGIELTPQEKKEAEQWQKDEQLRRRDPTAFFTLMEKRRKEQLDSVLRATLPSYPTAGVSTPVICSSQPTNFHSSLNASSNSSMPPPSTAPMAVTKVRNILSRIPGVGSIFPTTPNAYGTGTSPVLAGSTRTETPQPIGPGNPGISVGATELSVSNEGTPLNSNSRIVVDSNPRVIRQTAEPAHPSEQSSENGIISTTTQTSSESESPSIADMMAGNIPATIEPIRNIRFNRKNAPTMRDVANESGQGVRKRKYSSSDEGGKEAENPNGAIKRKPNFASTGFMETNFANFLRKEKRRHEDVYRQDKDD